MYIKIFRKWLYKKMNITMKNQYIVRSLMILWLNTTVYLFIFFFQKLNCDHSKIIITIGNNKLDNPSGCFWLKVLVARKPLPPQIIMRRSYFILLVNSHKFYVIYIIYIYINYCGYIYIFNTYLITYNTESFY